MDARVKPAHDSECVARRLKAVIAGLDPAIHDAARMRCKLSFESKCVAPHLKVVIAGLDPAIHDAAPECLTTGFTC
jgi:hypothetical protein